MRTGRGRRPGGACIPQAGDAELDERRLHRRPRHAELVSDVGNRAPLLDVRRTKPGRVVEAGIQGAPRDTLLRQSLRPAWNRLTSRTGGRTVDKAASFRREHPLVRSAHHHFRFSEASVRRTTHPQLGIGRSNPASRTWDHRQFWPGVGLHDSPGGQWRTRQPLAGGCYCPAPTPTA